MHMFNFSFHKPYSSRVAAEKIPSENLCTEKFKLIKVLWRRKTLKTSCDLNPNKSTLVFKPK